MRTHHDDAKRPRDRQGSEPFSIRDGSGLAAATVAIFYATNELAFRCGAGASLSRALAQVAILIVLAVATGSAAPSRLALIRPRRRFLLAAMLLGLGLKPWLTAFQSPFLKWLPPNHYAEALVQRESFAVHLALSVIIGPICEEMVFRGLLARSLATVWSRARALTVAALAFALYHASPYQLVDPFLFGLVVGYLTLQSGSIIPGIIVHVLVNALVAVSWYHRPAAAWDVLRLHGKGFSLLGAFAIVTGVVLAMRKACDGGLTSRSKGP